MTQYPAIPSRAGDNLARAKEPAQRGGVVAPLFWVSLVLIVLMAFIWWLLVETPVTN